MSDPILIRDLYQSVTYQFKSHVWSNRHPNYNLLYFRCPPHVHGRSAVQQAPCWEHRPGHEPCTTSDAPQRSQIQQMNLRTTHQGQDSNPWPREHHARASALLNSARVISARSSAACMYVLIHSTDTVGQARCFLCTKLDDKTRSCAPSSALVILIRLHPETNNGVLTPVRLLYSLPLFPQLPGAIHQLWHLFLVRIFLNPFLS